MPEPSRVIAQEPVPPNSPGSAILHMRTTGQKSARPLCSRPTFNTARSWEGRRSDLAASLSLEAHPAWRNKESDRVNPHQKDARGHPVPGGQGPGSGPPGDRPIVIPQT